MYHLTLANRQIKHYDALSLKPNTSVKLWKLSAQVQGGHEGTGYVISWLIRINSEKRLFPFVMSVHSPV